MSSGKGIPAARTGGLWSSHRKGIYPFTKGSYSVQAHVLWAQPAIETFARHGGDPQVNALDLDYIEGWVARLGLSSLWKEMLDNIS
jgi:hypothetical protein